MTESISGWKKQLITIAVFLFPILCVTLEHAGSSIYVVLLILGLVYGRQGWQYLDKDIKQLFVSLIFLFSIITLGLFYTVDLAEGASKLERYLRIVLIIPVFLMLKRFDLKLGKTFIVGVVMAIPVLALQGIYQVEVLDKAVATGAYHKIIYGNISVLFLSLVAVAVLTLYNNRAGYIVLFVLSLVALYAIVISGTRAAWLFIPIFILSLIFVYRNKISKRFWVIGTVGLLMVVSVVVFVQPKKLTDGFKTGLADIELYMENPTKFSSWGARLTFWRNSLIMFSESPVLGKGTGSYNAENIILLEKGITKAEYVKNFGHAHSIYFHTLAESGLLGIVLLVVALILLPLKYFYRYWKIATNAEQQFFTLAGMVSVIAFSWFGVSEMWLARNPFVNVYFMCMLIFMSSTANVFSRNFIEQAKA